MRRLARVAAWVVAGVAADGIAFAEDSARSATIIGPSNVLLADGASALDAGKVEEGIALTLEGLKSPNATPERAAGHSNLCAGYAMLKRWDEALEHCNAALDLDKNNWRTFNNRAAIYSAKGQFDLAVNDIRAGLDLSPNSHTLLESLRIIQQNKQLLSTRSRSSVRAP